jgi:hypothetical protein
VIYGYKYKTHKIEKFHDGIMEFFSYLFKNDPKSFDRAKMFTKTFEPNMRASYRKFDPIFTKLVTDYNDLNPSQKNKVKLAFKNNNKIEELCSGSLTPIKFDDFTSEFADELKDFGEKLWVEYNHNKTIKTNFGTVKDHYDALLGLDFQKALICPFCGLNGIKPSKARYRDAYDHYFPKSVFPFTSMNFKNLAPTCHECNSDEKGDKPVLFDITGKRQKVFYPFDQSIKINNIEFNITPIEKYNPVSKSTKLSNINWDYEVKISGKNDSRINAWENIYGVQRRYKERMPSMETEWFTWIINSYKEAVEYGVLFSKFKEKRLEEVHQQISSSEKGLMRYSYVSFILNQDNIESKLKLLTKI